MAVSNATTRKVLLGVSLLCRLVLALDRSANVDKVAEGSSTLAKAFEEFAEVTVLLSLSLLRCLGRFRHVPYCGKYGVTARGGSANSSVHTRKVLPGVPLLCRLVLALDCSANVDEIAESSSTFTKTLEEVAEVTVLLSLPLLLALDRSADVDEVAYSTDAIDYTLSSLAETFAAGCLSLLLTTKQLISFRILLV